MQDFDFEQWSQLHAEDPAAFDQQREAALQAFIDQANPDSRLMLEQTLFSLQMHRKKSKSDLQSAIYASNLMWEAFGKMREGMNDARQAFESAKPTLSIVTPQTMSQVDHIVNRWAVGQATGGYDAQANASDASDEAAEQSDGGATQPPQNTNVIAFRPRR
jgi:hypothetical protein